MNTSPDADRYACLELKLVCPKCGSGGLIPWKQLDHVLLCHRCQTRYRVERSGLGELRPPQDDRIMVQVRTHSSAWREHQAVIRSQANLGARLREPAVAWAASKRVLWMAVFGAIALTVGAVVAASRQPARPAMVEIPDSLEGRATLLAEALERRDTQQLIQLTDPAQHRALRIWLAHGSGLPLQLFGEERSSQAKVLSTSPPAVAGGPVLVRVQLGAIADGKQVVLDEQWLQRGDTWYFQPAQLRSPTEKTHLRSYSKQSRRVR